MPDEVRTIRVKGWGFWITWARLAFLVILCAAVPAVVTAQLNLNQKVDPEDLSAALRGGCARSVKGNADTARIVIAEARYKRAVLAATSVKGDVKSAATEALKVYDQVKPRAMSRVIVCRYAFPKAGSPRVVPIPMKQWP